jgi:hypothetical protein
MYYPPAGAVSRAAPFLAGIASLQARKRRVIVFSTPMEGAYCLPLAICLWQSGQGQFQFIGAARFFIIDKNFK